MEYGPYDQVGDLDGAPVIVPCDVGKAEDVPGNHRVDEE